MSWIHRVCTIAVLALLATASSCAQGPCGKKCTEQVTGTRAVEDSELGLSKTSVFDTPDPVVAAEAGKVPGENRLEGGYFPGSPPLIPHVIESMLPITASSNMCLACHDIPDQIGKPVAAGSTPPIPASHYTDLRRHPGTVTQQLSGTRFECNQCHVPQTDAKPLVANTYAQ